MLDEKIVPSDSNENGPLDKNFETLVKETLDLWHVPGVTVGVVDGDHVYTQGYGFSSLEDKKPMSPSTLFYAGSTTKAFTAAMMSFLVEDNENYPQVQWDTPIQHLIPGDFALENEYATSHTTIEDALSHRSGLPRHDQAYGSTSSGKRATVKEMIQTMRYLPLTAEPRTKYQYCNMMFVVAGHIIETLTGSKLGDLMKEKIWKPLGMNSTFSNLSDAKSAKEDLAKGYYYAKNKYHEVEPMELDQASGAGFVISNVLDYTKWAYALMSKKTPMSPTSLEALFKPRTIIPSDPQEPFTGPRAYALGWRVGVYRGYEFWEHTGGMNAFGAEFILFPELRFGVVAFANTAGTSNFVEQVLAFALVDGRLGVEQERRFDWNRRNQATIAKGLHKAAHAPSVYFPHTPFPPLRPTLPLPSYAGTYYHPSYQNLHIVFNPDTKTLEAERKEVTWPEKMRFQHVSGEFFVVFSEVLGDLNALFPTTYPVEFRVGSEGRVREVGVGWEEGMGEGRIWLVRVG